MGIVFWFIIFLVWIWWGNRQYRRMGGYFYVGENEKWRKK